MPNTTVGFTTIRHGAGYLLGGEGSASFGRE
jgi:hypothetical protein